jgi:hypothetical protein
LVLSYTTYIKNARYFDKNKKKIPQEVTVENLEETILPQNPELNMKPGEIAARFKFTTKRGESNMVIEVGPETRKKLL